MSGDVLIGFVLMGVALLVFLVWTWLQIRRVDRVIDEIGERGNEQGADAP